MNLEQLKNKAMERLGATGKDLFSGAIGLSKVAVRAAGVRVDEAPPDVVAERRRTCEACELLTRKSADGKMTTLSQCQKSKGGCGCFMIAKTSMASYSCPLGKWAAGAKSKTTVIVEST